MTTRNIALDIQRSLSSRPSSVTPILSPSSVAQRAAGLRQNAFGPDTYTPPNVPTVQNPWASKSWGKTTTPQVPQSLPGPTATTSSPFGANGAFQQFSNMQNMFEGGQDAFPSPAPMPGPTPPDALQTFFDQLLEAEGATREARERAAAIGAQLATASYDAQLNIIAGEIARTKEALGKVQGQWDAWREGALAVIRQTAEATSAAYATYVELINQGFTEYDALAQSRYGEYQGQVRAVIGDYMQKTNTRYEDFAASLPGTWGPTVEAIMSGNTAALTDIRAKQQDARNSVEGQVVERTGAFAAELEKIGADNPALFDELMSDLRATTALALEGVDLNANAAFNIQDATASIAARTVEHTMAQALRQTEEARLTAVNEAAREQHKLVTASQHQLDGILEQSGRTREQAIIDVQSELDNRLAQLDSSEDEIRQAAEENARDMSYQLSETIRDLINRQYQTGTNRSVAEASVYYGAELNDRVTASATEVARAFTLTQLDRISSLTPPFKAAILDQMEAFFASGMRTWEQFQQWNATQVDENGVTPIPQNQMPIYRAAVDAMNSAYTRYEQEYGAASGSNLYTSPLGGGFRLSSMYGMRPDSDNPGQTEMHHGIDMLANRGTPVQAVRGGRLVRYTNASAGNAVWIEHGAMVNGVWKPDGTMSKYAHLDGWANVPPTGTMVAPGQRIGNVGKTGNANAYHLHFSFWIDNNPVDPVAAGVFTP